MNSKCCWLQVHDRSAGFAAKPLILLLLLALIGSTGIGVCADTDYDKRIADAEARFDDGEFSQAEHLFSAILADIGTVPDHKDQKWEAAYSLGETYIQLGLFDKANAALSKSLSFAQNNASSDQTALARSWLSLAELRQLQKKWSEAANLRQKASEAAKHSKDGSLIQARVLDCDAQSAIQEGHYDRAQELWKEALAIRKKRLDANDPALICMVRNYAVALRSIGAVPLAHELNVQASQWERKNTGQAMPLQINALNCLAVASVMKDQQQAAEDGFKKALDLAHRYLPSSHPLVGDVLVNLGSLYGQERKFKDAEPLLKRALSVVSQAYGPTNWKQATVLNDLGAINLDQGKFDVAESYMKRSLLVSEQSFGENSPDVASELVNFGALFGRQGKYDSAVVYLIKAKGIYARLDKPSPKDLALCYANLAAMLAGQQKLSDAEAAIRQALTFGEKAYGTNSVRTAIYLNSLGKVLVCQGKYVEAEPVYKRSFDIMEKQLAHKHPNFIAALNSYTFVLRKLKRSSEASQLEKQFATN